MWTLDSTSITLDQTRYTLDGSTTASITLNAGTGIFTLVGEAVTFSLSPSTLSCATGIFTLVGQAVTMSAVTNSYTLLAGAGIFNLVGAPASSDFQIDVADGVFVLAGQPATLSGSLLLSLGTGIFTLIGIDADLTPTQEIPVCAVSAGYYDGEYYDPGDVFVIHRESDYSDSTMNAQPDGAEYAPGWMIFVPTGTPLYQAAGQQLYPTFPAVDPARRFVL